MTMPSPQTIGLATEVETSSDYGYQHGYLVILPTQAQTGAMSARVNNATYRCLDDIIAMGASELAEDVTRDVLVLVPDGTEDEVENDLREAATRCEQAGAPSTEMVRVEWWDGKGEFFLPAEFGDAEEGFLTWLSSQPDCQTEEAMPKPKRVEIEVTTNRSDMQDQVLKALPRDQAIYQRGSSLCMIGRTEGELALGSGSKLTGAEASPRLIPVTPTVLSTRLTRQIEFYCWRKDRSGESVSVPAHPPDWLARSIIEGAYYPGVPPLLGFAECPYPREDGSLVTQPGYDWNTATVLMSNVRGLAIPPHPTHDDACYAVSTLLAPFGQFPFEGEADRAAYLASILTMVARPAIRGPVPGFAVIGNRAGTGKGLLVDGAGIIATGRGVGTSPYPADPAEADKVKLSLALTGVQAVHFDNLAASGVYGTSGLDSALTSITVGGRILGQSQLIDGVPLRCCWWLTGNNLAPGTDAYRRWIPINLVTQLEEPEERADIEIGNLREHIKKKRRELLSAALTILAAHAADGRPRAANSLLGSFEEWDVIVRGAVYHATNVDPCETRKAAAQDSPDRMNRLAILGAMFAIQESTRQQGHTTPEILRAADEPGNGALRTALALLAPRAGDLPSAKSLGKTLGTWNRLRTGEFTLEQTSGRSGYKTWKVTRSHTDCPFGDC